MWTHYSSEGKGLAISFNEDHPFFKEFTPAAVSYSPEDRATFTYYKGTIRLNGNPIKDYQINDISEPLSFLSHLQSKHDIIIDLTKKLLYSKAEKWAYEEESRIVLPLELCEETRGEEVYLKKVPFDAFDSIILGYDISDNDT